MLACQRQLFDLPEDVSYLNCAYMSPLLRSVVAAGTDGLQRKAHPWELTPDQFFSGAEEFRVVASKLLDCEPGCVAITPSAGYGIQTAARNLKPQPGQAILVLDEQFPSNFYPWHRLAEEAGAALKTVAWPADHDWTSAVLRQLTADVAIAALPNVHWTSGGLLDLVRIGQACRKNGTALVLDLTQSLGAYPVSLREVQPDFAAAANYKWLLGPYSLGLLYVAPRWHEGRPLEEGWIQRANSRDFSSLILYSQEYDSQARRFDMGERANFALIPAAIRAMVQILEWKVTEISQTAGELARHIAEDASELGFESPAVPLRAPHYLCLRRTAPIPRELTDMLAREKVFVSVRGSSIRVAPHVYNSREDCDRLIRCLRRIAVPTAI